ncbi:DUF3541 domain-containing protein [Legionella sp. WA2024007413]
MKFLICLILFCSAVSYAEIADSILDNYQTNLDKLPIIRQEHFSIRMYRITGDKKHLNSVVDYVYFLSNKYQYLFSGLDQPELTLQKSKNLLLDANEKLAHKHKLRIKKISEYGDLFFYLYLLETTNKIFSYHLENTSLFPQTNTVIDVLKTQVPRLEEFIVNEENIRIYGAQLVNYVYYLYDLNIVDLRKSYTKLFQQTFPDSMDSQLSEWEYEAKLYGMTHFITAASHYYQNFVNDDSFFWISDYFERNMEQIMERAENDVIAEVGVCLLLLNKKDSPGIKKIREHLETVYNPQHQMIPARTNSVDFIFGEHRNILTVMLFKWPERLMDGPFFSEELTLIPNIFSGAS